MIFDCRIVITLNTFRSECRNFQVFTHFDLKMTLRFVVISSIAATIPKFVSNTRTSERWSFIFKCKKVTNFALSLENKPNITVLEFIFHYAVNSCAYLKRKLT